MAQRSGYHPTTVLAVQRPRPPSPDAGRDLQNPQGFGRYKEVPHWLQVVCGVKLTYQTKLR